MVTAFDLDELKRLLSDFYRITGIRITVFDEGRREVAAEPAAPPDFCRLIRGTEAGRAACAACDREACRIASRRDKVYLYRCHAGLTEAIMPLYVEGALAGYLLCGHMFAFRDADEGWATVRQCCEAYPIDPADLRKACLDRPQLSEEYIHSAARILHATASYLILERLATLQESSDAARLSDYLAAHFAEDIDADTLCRELGLGRTSLYRLSERLYGTGPAARIRAMRMDKARQLLGTRRDLSIADVGLACGYPDYNYFISVFTREVGVPPGKYRSGHRKEG